MATWLVALACAAGSALLAVLQIRLSPRLGWMDRPGPLKRHEGEVPTLGGISVALSFLAGLWLLAALRTPLWAETRALWGLTIGGGVILSLGIWDDLRGCKAAQKFLVQIAGALVLFGFGFRIERVTNPFSDAISLDFLGFPLTVLWVVGVTNAINLLDGVDGLAAGTVLIASGSLVLIGLRHGELLLAVPGALLAASLLGFLRFNLPPARIFLGDTGSLFLGFTLSALSLIQNRKGTVAATLLLPIVLMALPLVDTLLALFRRLLNRRHPFRGDMEHLHHRLLRLGLDPRQVLGICYGVSVCLGVVAYFLSILPKQYAMVLVLLLAVGIYLSLRLLLSAERRRGIAPVGHAASRVRQVRH